MGKGYSVHHRRVSEVKRVEFVRDRVSCIVLRGRWCNIIVLNVYGPSEETSDDSKDSFYEELEQVFFIIFLITIRKFYLEILRPKWEERIFSNRQLVMRAYIRITMIMVKE